MTVGPGSFDDVLPSRAARLAAERARRLYAGVGILIGSTLAVTALLGIPAALANAASDGASVAFDQAPVADGDLGAGRSPIDDAIPTAPLDGDPTTQDQAIPGQDPFSTAPVPPSPRRVPAEEPDRGGRGSTMQFSFLLTHRPFDDDGDDDEPGLTAGPGDPRTDRGDPKTGEFALEPAADAGHRLDARTALDDGPTGHTLPPGEVPAISEGPTGHTLPPGEVPAIPEQPSGHTLPPNSLLAPADLRAQGAGTDPVGIPRVNAPFTGSR